jgi:hypothetical protein
MAGWRRRRPWWESMSKKRSASGAKSRERRGEEASKGAKAAWGSKSLQKGWGDGKPGAVGWKK